jgi:hypothetical protein
MATPRISRWIVLAVVFATLFVAGTAVAVSSTASLANFPTKALAQQHCRANLPTGIYRFKGMRWYGRTNSGAYVCHGDADRAGMRPTRTGNRRDRQTSSTSG